MSANRAVFCLVMSLFCIAVPSVPRPVGPTLLLAGLPTAAILFGHLLLRPEPSPARRTVALMVDTVTISMVMHFGNAATSCFYPLILWTIFGNGIRFGLRDLAVATGCGLLGFSAVVLTTPFWQANPSLSIGLVAGTIIVPAYSSHLIRTLTAAREAAEQASQAKTRFLANISHDLRTPLQALIGTSELLSTTTLTASQGEMVGTSISAGQSLLSMVNSLLRFTQLQEAPTEPEMSVFDPVALVHHAIRVSAPICTARGLTLTANMAHSLPATMMSDRHRLDEVLINLISNAAKFTQAGGVLVTVAPARPALLRFEVIDTGIGVPEAARERIFDRFAQGDDTVRMRFGGSGMGLAICRELVAGLGGRIGLGDARVSGSTFWFEVPTGTTGDRPYPDSPEHAPLMLLLPEGPVRNRFAMVAAQEGRDVIGPSDPEPPSVILVTAKVPAARSDAAPADMRADRPAGQRRATILVGDAGTGAPGTDDRWLADVCVPSACAPEDIRRAMAICDTTCRLFPGSADPGSADGAVRPGLRVLIVDDNKVNQLIFSRILSGGGYGTSLASDGEQALVALEQEHFDLVLMDVNMPVIDGLQATRLQRVAELGSSRVPIIGLTADGTGETRKECMAAGMDDCLTKPILPGALLQAIQRTLDTASTDGNTGEVPRPAPASPETVLVDWAVLGSLQALAGPEFVAEVLAEFERDAMSVLRELEASVGKHDLTEARHLGHSLASIAANVGAASVKQMGLRIETLADPAIEAEGHVLVDQALDALQCFLHAVRSGDAGHGGHPASGRHLAAPQAGRFG